MSTTTAAPASVHVMLSPREIDALIATLRTARGWARYDARVHGSEGLDDMICLTISDGERQEIEVSSLESFARRIPVEDMDWDI